MIRSLYTGEAGIKTHQTRMDVIGNNVANVNTTGFKSGRGTFDDILSQTLKGATASNGTLGSTNPTQIGLGVKLSAVDMMFRNGSIQSTGKNTDLALSGDGLFALKDATRTYYTRNGDFGFDEAGNYVQNGTGLFVQGWMATNGVVTPGGATTNINVQMGKVMPAKVTTEEYYHANLDASTPIGKTVDVSMNEYGADGTLVSRPMHFTKTANNSWTVTSDPSVSSGSWTINFDEHGKFAGGSGLISYTDGKGAQGVTVHMGDLTQYDSGDAPVPEPVKWYRVRKSWSDSKSQKGAYKILENAKKCADENPGYKVFDSDGVCVYTPKATTPEPAKPDVPFLVKVTINNLNIRKGPGTGFARTQYIPRGVYTIVDTAAGSGASLWGKLKSGAGWISLDYVTRL